MRPFNLQAALDGAAVVTADGREVIIAGFNGGANESERVAGWVSDDGDCLESWNGEGNYIAMRRSGMDLFMAPAVKTYWVNVYRDIEGEPFIGGGVYGAEDDAKEMAGHASGLMIKTISFEIEAQS